MADKDRKTVPFSPKKKATTQPTAGERPTVPFRGSREGKPSRGEAFGQAEADYWIKRESQHASAPPDWPYHPDMWPLSSWK